MNGNWSIQKGMILETESSLFFLVTGHFYIRWPLLLEFWTEILTDFEKYLTKWPKKVGNWPNPEKYLASKKAKKVRDQVQKWAILGCFWAFLAYFRVIFEVWSIYWPKTHFLFLFNVRKKLIKIYNKQKYLAI
jgi:hypothetical protein